MDITLASLIETFDKTRLDDTASYEILSNLYKTNLSGLMDNLIAHSVEPLFVITNQEQKDKARRLVVKAINIRLAGRALNTGKNHEPIV